MGLLKDAIGSAMGAGQVKNGFNGPSLPFMGRPNNTPSPTASSFQRNSSTGQYGDDSLNRDNSTYRTSYGHQPNPYTRRMPPDVPPPYQTQEGNVGRARPYEAQPEYDEDWEMDYGKPRSEWSLQPDPYVDRRSRGNLGYDAVPSAMSSGPRGDPRFRPLVLPQIGYGDGTPFLRGYSHELGRYGISEGDFIRILDAINVAVIPNPENQIFQKAANIAGYFVPGSAGIGLMAGQIGVGIGAAFGHASQLNKVLSKANLGTFLPQGIEICIGKSKDVDVLVGGQSPYAQRTSSGASSPEQRLAAYGSSIAPVTSVLPPLESVGRRDPIAMLGRGIGDRDQQRKQRRADRGMARNRTRKADDLEAGLSWLMVRPAAAESIAYWQNTLSECNNAEAQAGR